MSSQRVTHFSQLASIRPPTPEILLFLLKITVSIATWASHWPDATPSGLSEPRLLKMKIMTRSLLRYRLAADKSRTWKRVYLQRSKKSTTSKLQPFGTELASLGLTKPWELRWSWNGLYNVRRDLPWLEISRVELSYLKTTEAFYGNGGGVFGNRRESTRIKLQVTSVSLLEEVKQEKSGCCASWDWLRIYHYLINGKWL